MLVLAVAATTLVAHFAAPPSRSKRPAIRGIDSQLSAINTGGGGGGRYHESLPSGWDEHGFKIYDETRMRIAENPCATPTPSLPTRPYPSVL